MQAQEAEGLLEAIRIIGSDCHDLLGIDRRTGEVFVYRFSGELAEKQEELQSSPELCLNAYINRAVIERDRAEMRQSVILEEIVSRLKRTSSFTVHYRVEHEGSVHYHCMRAAREKGRNDFDLYVLGFSCEDSSFHLQAVHDMATPGQGGILRQILLISGKSEQRQELAEQLQGDYRILETDTGTDGLQIMHRHYRELSAVITELEAPGLGALALLEEAARDPLLQDLPVMVIADSDREDRESVCLEAGAAEFIHRPLVPGLVRARLRNIIRLQEASAAVNRLELDDLTHLYTRQAFIHYAGNRLRNSPGQDWDVFVINIAGFRTVNSIYGRETGNLLLQYVAEDLERTMPDALIARYTADRFIGLIPTMSPERLEQVEQERREAVKRAPVRNLRIKMGIYARVDKDQAVEVLYDRALTAMKSIQDNYDHMVAYYDGPLTRRMEWNQRMEDAFELALVNGEFAVWYQPKIDIVRNRIAGAEALVRWTRPDGTVINPADFVPLFEEDGLIARLDEAIFRRVCSDLHERLEKDLPVVPISVNMSRATLHRDGTVERYRRIAREENVPVELLPIELTESAAFMSKEIKGLTGRLKLAGFPLHMDDFGSGYSSLSSLNLLPFDVVKLDKTLIDYIGSPRDEKILSHTVALAHELGIQVVAEGVESPTQAAFLRTIGCTIVQGYYFSKPVPPEEFGQMLLKQSRV